MSEQHGIFNAKLAELEGQYRRLCGQVLTCQGRDHPAVQQALAQAGWEYKEIQTRLEESIRACRCPRATRLARTQLDYLRGTQALLEPDQPKAGPDGLEAQAEAAALYAEYAMDLAAQATRYALLAALRAVDRQMAWEERMEEPK